MEEATKIGFIGVGTIARAVILGLLKGSPLFKTTKIALASEDKRIARELANCYEEVELLESNQAVVNVSDKIFLCVPSQQAQTVLEALSFRKDQAVISFVAMAQKVELEAWTKHSVKIYRAVPLPFIEERKGVTPFYPQNEFLNYFFGQLGGAIGLDKEEALNGFLLGGSMMGVYFRFLGCCEEILRNEGLPPESIHNYLITMFGNLSDVMRQHHNLSFEQLEQDYSTKKGTNELFANSFQEKGGISALKEAASLTLLRICNKE